MRIDAQSHVWPQPFLDYLQSREQEPLAFRDGAALFIDTARWRRRAMPGHSDVAAKLRTMDRNGIDVTVLSPNDPGPERFGSDGPRAARMLNDYVAAQTRAHPDRFLGLCVLPLHHEPESRQELERAVHELDMRGVLLYANLDGRHPDEPDFEWLFQRADQLRLPLYLHPACPVTYAQVEGRNLVGALGLMFDTTIALARIIVSGLMDRYPDAPIVCPHVGGALPYLIGRLDHQTMVLGRGAENLTRPPSEYLRQVWFDTVSPWPAAVRYGLEMVGPNQLMFASDHPWVEPDVITSIVDELPVTDEERARIYGGNAARLFKIGGAASLDTADTEGAARPR